MSRTAREVWVDGRFQGPERAIAADDRGFLLGDGAFETVLVSAGEPAFLRAHLDRLQGGLEILGIPCPAFGPARAAIAELARRNGLASQRAAARITVTRGRGGRGLAPPRAAGTAPTLLVAVTPAPERSAAPLRLMISQRIKPSRCSTSGFKSLSGYAENLLARRDAAEAGHDDAILVNEAGRVVSASAANVFVLNGDGVLATPPLEEGATPGVVRAIILERAREAGLEARETPIAPEALLRGGVLLTNSLIGVAPAVLRGCGAAAAGFGAQVDALAKAYENALREDLAEAPSRP